MQKSTITEKSLLITSKKAEKILGKKKEKLDKFNLVLSAGLCPTCGRSLILKAKKWTTKEKRGLFRREVDVPHKWDYFACPGGHPLVNPEGKDRSYPGCCEYEGLKNPNKIIYNYWRRYFSGDLEDEGGF